MKIKDYELCYIEDNFAWFTNNFKEQSGDDWDDAPYELNAGEPYDSRCGDKYQTIDLVKVAFRSFNLHTPADNSYRCSVDYINSGHLPWLGSNKYYPTTHVEIYAGMRLEDFINTLELEGAEVYIQPKHLEQLK